MLERKEAELQRKERAGNREVDRLSGSRKIDGCSSSEKEGAGNKTTGSRKKLVNPGRAAPYGLCDRKEKGNPWRKPIRPAQKAEDVGSHGFPEENLEDSTTSG